MRLGKDTVRLLAPKSEAHSPARTDRLTPPRWETEECEGQAIPKHTHAPRFRLYSGEGGVRRGRRSEPLIGRPTKKPNNGVD